MGKPSGKHLDLSKRQVIYNCLVNNNTAKEIAYLVDLDPTSVSREVKKRRTLKKEIIMILQFVSTVQKRRCVTLERIARKKIVRNNVLDVLQ